MKEHLESLNDIDGFLCAGIFSGEESLCMIENELIDLDKFAKLINTVLEAQENSSYLIRSGITKLLHIQSHQYHIMAKYLQIIDKGGFIFLILNKDGNVALGKLKLNRLSEIS